MKTTLKSIILLVILLLPLTNVKGQQNMAGRYRLTLDLHRLKTHSAKIYFWYDVFVNGEKVAYQDSSIVKNNKAEFIGSVNEPHEAVLSAKPRLYKGKVLESDRLNFYLTTGKITISPKDSLNVYDQTGGLFKQDYQDFQKIKKHYDYQIIAAAVKVSHLDKLKNPAAYSRASVTFDSLVSYYANQVCRQWVIKHPKSPVALLPLRWFAGSVIDNATGVDSLYNLLSAAVKQLPAATDLKQRTDNVMRAAVGNPAPLFAMADTAGKPVSLAAYRGKFILLDFWASWCAPCRRENPNVIASFTKHQRQNFMVISVSLDNQATRSAWLKAIHTDHLEQWPHVSDLKGFNNAAALLYGVQAVPQNFLIDPSGKIIGRNLFGQALSEKLAAVLAPVNKD